VHCGTHSHQQVTASNVLCVLVNSWLMQCCTLPCSCNKSGLWANSAPQAPSPDMGAVRQVIKLKQTKPVELWLSISPTQPYLFCFLTISGDSESCLAAA
jgi:hypothetical protein